MSLDSGKRGVIAILTGGGDVPGLNPAIRAVTIRAIREGYQVIGIRRGWAGAIEIIRDKGGPSIQKECDKIGHTPVGTAVITGSAMVMSQLHSELVHLFSIAALQGGRHSSM